MGALSWKQYFIYQADYQHWANEVLFECLGRLDPKALANVIVGCHKLDLISDNHYQATLDMGVGPIRGLFNADIRLFDLNPPRRVSLKGSVVGPLGSGSGVGHVHLEPAEGGTRVSYTYEVKVAGKVAAVGGRMLDGAARALIRQFFNGLVRQSGGSPRRGLVALLRERFGGRA